MKTRQITAYGLITVFFALTLTACPGPTPHTHDWGNWVVTTPATATTPGEETRTCNTCGEKVTRPIPPTGSTHVHEYADTWSSNATQHWHECSCGDKKDVANHTGDPCTVCGYTGTTHVHAYATTWSKDATQHWHECSCGDKADVANHQWEWIVTTPATPTADGLETETCGTCGATNGTRPIAMLPQNQTATIALEFGANNYTATVTGYFSNTEWDGIPQKIETALNGAFTAGNIPTKNRFNLVFGQGVTITVEKTSEYNSYKVIDGAFRTLYLNYDYLLSATDTDLQEKIITAVTAMRNDEAKTE